MINFIFRSQVFTTYTSKFIKRLTFSISIKQVIYKYALLYHIILICISTDIAAALFGYQEAVYSVLLSE